ncbi:MAG: GNAT family N-acetyltransferase [Mycobacteriales bacterium]
MQTPDAVPAGAPVGVGPAGGAAAEEVVLRDGTPARIWPLLPTDARVLRVGFRALSPESRRRRFLTATRELDDRMIRRLVHDVDGQRHVALVVVAFPAGGVEQLVGVGRLVQEGADPTTADLAVTVADEWQGRGVGAALSRALLDRRPRAIRRLSTVVAAENAAALGLLRGLGGMSTRPEGPGVLEVTVELADDADERSGLPSPQGYGAACSMRSEASVTRSAAPS